MADNAEKNLQHNTGPLRISVLGGGGFIGGVLVLNLIHMGYRLNLLTHRTNPDFISPGGQITTTRGSIDDESSLMKCFQEADIVYHLVGIIAETGTKTFQKTVADGTRRVVSAAKKAGIKKIVFLSALGTTEEADSEYLRTKWEAEQYIINSGIDYTIFRPSIVYGPGDQFINKIAGMIRVTPLLPVIGDGLYKLQPVYVEELCGIMTMSAEQDSTSGKIYEIGGPEQLTYLEILDIIKRVMARKRAAIHIPLWFVNMGACLMEKMMNPAPLTRDQLKMMAAGSTCNQKVAEKEFGIKFSPLEMQLIKYLRK
jgi:NADH dehydrogenase